MRISSSIVFSLLAYSQFVSAAPAKGCSLVNTVYLVLKGSPQLKAFSVYLSILGGDKTVSQTRVSRVAYTLSARNNKI
jgi:hypothetical protein